MALWNADEERIEMRLRSRTDQTVVIADLELTVRFRTGEDLRTELSCKFRQDALTAELRDCGLRVLHWWTDADARFTLLLATPDQQSSATAWFSSGGCGRAGRPGPVTSRRRAR